MGSGLRKWADMWILPVRIYSASRKESWAQGQCSGCLLYTSGVGVPITEPSLGLLVKTGFDVLFSGLWWASVFPGLYIMLIVFGINLLGDFLRDELNPNLK